MIKPLTRAGLAAVAALALLSGAHAQDVKIDARLNIAAQDKSNYLGWSFGGDSRKDHFDAATGASVDGSTESLNAVRYDGVATKKATIPAGLRGIFLLPLSDYATATADGLSVSANGKEIVVRHVHRGIAYELKTDKNGKFDPLTGCRLARNFAELQNGAYAIKADYLKSGGDPKKMGSLDWSKLAFENDVKNPAASRWYEGSLDFALTNDILTFKGTLIEKKAK